MFFHCLPSGKKGRRGSDDDEDDDDLEDLSDMSDDEGMDGGDSGWYNINVQNEAYKLVVDTHFKCAICCVFIHLLYRKD